MTDATIQADPATPQERSWQTVVARVAAALGGIALGGGVGLVIAVVVGWIPFAC
jgi:ABC-type glucose/galactose transport system permease subunit